MTLEESLRTHKPFTAGGTISNKLLIFDIDDTIIYSNASVKIYKNNRLIKTISSSEYNTYVLKPGESYDFSNFESGILLSQAKLTKYWYTLKREYNKGTHICILTARSNKKMIREFFLKKKIDIKPDLIFCTTASDFPYGGNVSERKAAVIEQLHKVGYKTFVFFDDNVNNLKSAKLLETSEDIKIYTVHAKI